MTLFVFLFVTFLCGIGNFTTHRAVMESGHPMITDTRDRLVKILGPYGTYILEFGMLLAALTFANMGMASVVIFYFIYSLVNFTGAYMLLSNKF